MLLEEEAECRIGKGQKQVVVRIEGVGVAGEAVRKQLQLVVGGTGGHDAALVQLGF